MNQSNKDQIDLWNGRVGAKWAAMQISLDAMMAPATQILAERAGSIGDVRILDVGCGNGETCAVWIDGGAQVTGIDVSEAMLQVAQTRTGGRARLIQADASLWRDDVPFDLVVSQFGLMFFADPDSAFLTIASNLRPGGRLLFACWRDVRENQWVSLPMAAIEDLLPESAAPPANAPGPFALADQHRITGILQRAGFGQIAIEPREFAVCVASTGGVDAAVRFLLQIGPTSAALANADDATRSSAKERLRAALIDHDSNGHVTLGGAMWVVEAVRTCF